MRAMGYEEMIYHHPDAPPRKEPAYSDDGVDLTLIRGMLDLTPSQRLRQLQGFINAVARIRRAMENGTRHGLRSPADGARPG